VYIIIIIGSTGVLLPNMLAKVVDENGKGNTSHRMTEGKN
jgi:hypothetical protein